MSGHSIMFSGLTGEKKWAEQVQEGTRGAGVAPREIFRPRAAEQRTASPEDKCLCCLQPKPISIKTLSSLLFHLMEHVCSEGARAHANRSTANQHF